MKKTYSKNSRQGLPGGPNEMFEKVKGIIVSQRGQWDFPGMNTLVPTDDGRITMRGVPYPVYGQDETGYGQMMYPGQEYQFPGNNVLELPMAQVGLENNNIEPIIRLNEYDFYDNALSINERLANTAKKLYQEGYDVSRPAAGGKEKIESYINDVINPTLKKSYYTNTCVKGVCDVFKRAEINSGIPEDVLDNDTFFKNYKEYGFDLITDKKDLQPGDIIQYYNDKRPYHMGIYVGNNEYISDGSSDKPFTKSNIYYYDDEPSRNKDNFRVFRKIDFKKQLGGALPRFQNTGESLIPDASVVKYGTPEYEEAYRTGNLLVNGVRPLPEFKVTPDYKSLSDELRRAAIIGTKEAAELTGVPGAVRFVKNPVQSLKGAGNTIVDLGMTIGPLAAMNPTAALKYTTQGINPLTGEGSFRSQDVEGAFNTLDAAGLATMAGAGLKTPVQQGVKQLAKSPIGDYAKEFGHSIKKGKLPTYETIYRWQPDVFPESLVEAGKNLTPLQQGLTGSWYTKYPGQLAFYMRTRPGAGNVNRIRLSDRQIANLESSMPDYAKGMSGKVESVPTSKSQMPGELIVPESIKSKAVPIRFKVNPIDYPISDIAERRAKIKRFLPDIDYDEAFLPDALEDNARNIYTPILKAQEQPILGIPRKYFPFQDGGSLPKAQILGQFNPQLFKPNPITGLYNWEKPRVKTKLSDFEPKQKAAPRSSTSVATKQDPVKAARQINSVAAEEYERNRQGVIRATNRPVSVFRPGAGDPEAVMEFTGVPSAVRIAQNPESVNDFLSGVDQLILGSSPVSGMMGMRRDFTPEETQALLDYSTVATMGLPLVRGAGKLGAQGLKQTGKYLTTQTPLKEAWRLNPRAYQYNLPENTMWRGLGQEGMEDAISSGLFRSKQGVIPEYVPGTKLQLNKSFGTNPYFTPKFKTAATYGDNYVAEVPRDAANWTQRYKRSNWSQVADRPIPISEGRILQKDWLRGYKPINTPKQLPGSSNAFKSEIDWGKWNKEIPENKALMQEYNTIEQQAKANGTWMKNPDGSTFQGTPEQFVQQNSENFKKAFPKGHIKSYRGSHQHIADFKNRDRNDFALFTTDNKVNAETYATSDGLAKSYYHPDINIHPNYDPNIKTLPLDYSDGIYQLAIPDNLPKVIGDAEGRNWRLLNYDAKIAEGTKTKGLAKEFQKELKDFKELYNYSDYNPSKEYLSTDIYANYVKNTNNPEAIAQINNVKDQMGFVKGIPANTVYAIDANRVPIKSLMYNNGMFDMTNPNIYKSLAPVIGAGLGIYGANQMQNTQPMQRFGGNLNFQNGGEFENCGDFENFVNTLPDNLRYSDSNYNLRGMWEASGSPKSFLDVKDTDYFPLQDDGSYHGFSTNFNTGDWLKSKQHPSAWMEYLYGYQLNPENNRRFNVVPNVEGYFGENQLQYIPKQFGGSLPTAGDPVLNFIQSQSPRFSKSKK